MSQNLSELLVRNAASPHSQSLYVKFTALTGICSLRKFFKSLEFARNVEIFVVYYKLLPLFVVIVLNKVIKTLLCLLFPCSRRVCGIIRGTDPWMMLNVANVSWSFIDSFFFFRSLSLEDSGVWFFVLGALWDHKASNWCALVQGSSCSSCSFL